MRLLFVRDHFATKLLEPVLKTIHPLLERETDVEIVDQSHEPWLLVRCKETDFHFLANPPKYDRLSEEFAWEKTHQKERETKDQSAPLMRFASSFAKTVKFKLRPNRDKMFALARRVLQDESSASFRVMDVGCGNGRKFSGLVDRLQTTGIDVVPFGIEVSSHLADVSRERLRAFGGDVIQNNAVDGVESVQDGSLDLVTMHSFLEHEAKPLTLLQRIRSALKPTGALLVKVPNFACWNRVLRGKRWPGFRFPDHVSYFTPDSLRMLANEAGYRRVEQRLMDRLPTSDNMYAVLYA